MRGKASSSTMRRGAWGQGAWCQGPGHHEEGAALHVAPLMSLGALQPQEGTWSSPSWVWGGSVLGASFCHGASPPSETGAGGVLLGTGAEMFKRLFAAWLWLSWHGAAASRVMLSWKHKQQREGFTGRGSSSGVWGHPWCAMVCGVHQVLPAGTCGPPGPGLGCTITSCQGLDPRGGSRGSAPGTASLASAFYWLRGEQGAGEAGLTPASKPRGCSQDGEGDGAGWVLG